jgi:stage II sporulation protein GA (sporulation sigma-E factor processing peptidase)
MVIYADGVMLLNFLVDLLLIMGTNRLLGYPGMGKRACAGAALGSVYSGVCLLPGFRFLGSNLWRVICLVAISVLAFGWKRESLKKGVFFGILSMALGGIAVGIGNSSAVTLVLSTGVLYLLCTIFAGHGKARVFSQLELAYGGNTWKITALQDTGNLLKDPVTGQSVIVVGGRIAREMLGLTEELLADPIKALTAGSVTGLRLIPYKALGSANGLLPALMLDAVCVDGNQAGRLVAFSKELTGEDGFEALIGGTI